MYKFIILSIENKQIDFLMVLEFIPSSYDVNKVVIKSIMHAKNIYIFFLVFSRNVISCNIFFIYIFFVNMIFGKFGHKQFKKYLMYF
jgi:hypothetical protein